MVVRSFIRTGRQRENSIPSHKQSLRGGYKNMGGGRGGGSSWRGGGQGGCELRIEVFV